MYVRLGASEHDHVRLRIPAHHNKHSAWEGVLTSVSGMCRTFDRIMFASSCTRGSIRVRVVRVYKLCVDRDTVCPLHIPAHPDTHINTQNRIHARANTHQHAHRRIARYTPQTHAHTHTRTNTHRDACTHLPTHTCTHTHAHTLENKHKHTHIHMRSGQSLFFSLSHTHTTHINIHKHNTHIHARTFDGRRSRCKAGPPPNLRTHTKKEHSTKVRKCRGRPTTRM